MNIDRLVQMRALGIFVNELIIDPAIAVACNLPIGRLHRLYDIGISFQRHRNTEYGYREHALAEQSMQTPESRA